MKYIVLITLVLLVYSVEAQTKELNALQTLSNSVSSNDDRHEVIKKATQYIKKYGTISEAYEIRARAYEWIDKEKSVADYKKAIELDSTNVNALNGLGNVLSDLEQYEEALKYYELALENGGYSGILLNVANLYETIKDYEGWERTALRMIEPDMDGFNRQLGYISLARMFKSKGDQNRAVDNYIKACGIGSPNGSYLRETALLLIELDRKEEACDYLKRAQAAHDYEYGCCGDIPALIESNCTEH